MSYAFGSAFPFSYIGFFGATGGGGDTENAKAVTAVATTATARTG
jgi:hypothetical protein